MSQINFELLNTNAPYEVGTSFQRGMNEAMLRKQAMERFEADKQQREITNLHNQQQQDLTRYEYGTRRMAVEEKARAMSKNKIDNKNEGRQALMFYKTAFPDMKFNASFDDDGEYQIIPISGSTSDNQNSITDDVIDYSTGYRKEDNAIPGGYEAKLPQKKPYNENIAKFYGFNDDQMMGLRDVMVGMPGVATTHLKDMFRANLKRKLEGGGVGKENDFTQWLNMSPEQRQQYETFKGIGKKPLVDMRGASFGGNATLPDMGEASKAAGKEFGKFAQNAVDAAQAAYDVSNDVEMVVDGLSGMGGGPVAEFKAWAGKAMPAGTDWANMASMNDLAKTVQVKLAPTMRAAGSGATSDFEMKAFMAAIPSLSTTERGRLLMSKYTKRVADRAQARAEVVNDIEQAGRLPTPKEIAQRMESKVGKAFFDAADRAYFGMKESAAKPAARPAAQAPATGKLSPSEQKELDDLRRRFGT